MKYVFLHHASYTVSKALLVSTCFCGATSLLVLSVGGEYAGGGLMAAREGGG